jgi:benzoate membrane transport protein
MSLELPSDRSTSLQQLWLDFGLLYAANGFVSWLFSVTAPVAIILSTGSKGGLTEGEIASWIFGVFFFNGLITTVLSCLYRQPLILLWTIPGAVLVGQSLSHLTFPEVIGAYYATSFLIFVLGTTGAVKRAMVLFPLPIVMGMVAAVFLRFGIDLVRALFDDIGIAGPMAVAWLLFTMLPKIGRRMPPIIGALIVGAAATIVLGRFDSSLPVQVELARPLFQAPAWSVSAMVELVVPLAITVIAVQNAQGIAILSSAGHVPPVNTITTACGIGSALAAISGGSSTCLTGPSNGIVVATGELKRQYTSAMLAGLLAVLFGLFAPTFTRLLIAAPNSLVVTLAGLAMLRVLQSAFNAAFKERYSLGALVAFLVTIIDVPILGIGAAFWGLVIGTALSWLLERGDHAEQLVP